MARDVTSCFKHLALGGQTPFKRQKTITS